MQKTTTIVMALLLVMVWSCAPTQEVSPATHNQYIELCGACHGRNAEYLKEKEEWMFEKTFDSIYRVIQEGVPDRGMPAYGSTLSEKEIKQITEFVLLKVE